MSPQWISVIVQIAIVAGGITAMIVTTRAAVGWIRRELNGLRAVPADIAVLQAQIAPLLDMPSTLAAQDAQLGGLRDDVRLLKAQLLLDEQARRAG